MGLYRRAKGYFGSLRERCGDKMECYGEALRTRLRNYSMKLEKCCAKWVAGLFTSGMRYRRLAREIDLMAEEKELQLRDETDYIALDGE